MIEYLVGPVVAVVISLKYTKYMTDKQSVKCEACCAQIESVEKKLVSNISKYLLFSIIINYS